MLPHAPDGYVDLQYETPVRCGQILVGQDAGVHTIRNASTDGEWLVTVHVYSPPLRDIRMFRPRPEPPSEDRRRAWDRTPTVVRRRRGLQRHHGGGAGPATAHEAGLNIKVVLVERRGAMGEGVAYSTREPVHLLNVPAGRMQRLAGSP